MDQSYWLGRKRAAAANARGADSSRARLVHLDLAGRYSVMAAMAPDARRLASQPAEAERQEHLSATKVQAGRPLDTGGGR